MRILTAATAVLLLVLAGGSSGRPAHAQEETRTVTETAGPYRVQVEIAPAAPVVGVVHFLVRPTLERTGEPVTDARVELYFGREGREEIKAPALNAPADLSTYVANADIDQPADWTVRVDVQAPPGGADLSFVLTVRPRARSGLVAPTLAYLGAAAIIVGGVAWLVRSSRKARRRAA